jgi:hypothetical protein
MTPDDWWTRLVYEEPTPVAEIRACHMSKLHISVARHLATGHGVRFERQVGLHVLTAKHKDFHGLTVLWPDLPHTHGPPHEPSQSLTPSR